MVGYGMVWHGHQEWNFLACGRSSIRYHSSSPVCVPGGTSSACCPWRACRWVDEAKHQGDTSVEWLHGSMETFGCSGG
eukprot:366009-Chlamydomonas_euryale.AAC.23